MRSSAPYPIRTAQRSNSSERSGSAWVWRSSTICNLCSTSRRKRYAAVSASRSSVASSFLSVSRLSAPSVSQPSKTGAVVLASERRTGIAASRTGFGWSGSLSCCVRMASPPLRRPQLTARSAPRRRPFGHQARSPQVRALSFPAPPPDLWLRALHGHWPARPGRLRPRNRFLFVGAQIRSLLPSASASRPPPCDSLEFL